MGELFCGGGYGGDLFGGDNGLAGELCGKEHGGVARVQKNDNCQNDQRKDQPGNVYAADLTAKKAVFIRPVFQKGNTFLSCANYITEKKRIQGQWMNSLKIMGKKDKIILKKPLTKENLCGKIVELIKKVSSSPRPQGKRRRSIFFGSRLFCALRENIGGGA